MDRQKVLVIEHDEGWQSYYERQLNGSVSLLKAITLEDGHQLFCEHAEELCAVIIGGSTPGEARHGEELTTLRLLAIIRTSFHGPIFGTVGDKRLQESLRLGGCTDFCPRNDVPVHVRRALNTEEVT